MSVHRHNLVASRTTTDSENLTPATANYQHLKGLMANYVDATFYLIVTAAATDVGDTFDVYLDSSYNSSDPVPCWDEFAHFQQVLGNGGAVQHILHWSRGVTPETEGRAPTEASLAANNVLQGPVGPDVRVRVAITDAGTDNASFTWRVEMVGFDPSSSG